MSVSVCLVWPRCVYANTFSILVFIPVTTEVDKRFSANKCFYRCTASLEAVRHSYRRRRYDRPFVHASVKTVIIANSSVTVTAGKRRFSQRYRLSSWLQCCQGQPILHGDQIEWMSIFMQSETSEYITFSAIFIQPHLVTEIWRHFTTHNFSRRVHRCHLQIRALNRFENGGTQETKNSI